MKKLSLLAAALFFAAIAPLAHAQSADISANVDTNAGAGAAVNSKVRVPHVGAGASSNIRAGHATGDMDVEGDIRSHHHHAGADVDAHSDKDTRGDEDDAY